VPFSDTSSPPPGFSWWLIWCATVSQFVLLRNYVLVWVSQNYILFLKTASQVSGRYSWSCWNIGTCLVVRFLETLSQLFLCYYKCGPFLISVYIIFMLWQSKFVHVCTTASQVSIFTTVFIYVINYLTKEHQFKTDGQFDLVYGVYFALGTLPAARESPY
jgi:hypothetical protein